MHWIDPAFLPETSGVVEGFLQNADGEADGLLLANGLEVHFPPHLAEPVLAAIKPGSTIRVRGVRPRGITMIAAVSLAPEEGAEILDAGPTEHHKAERKRRNVGRTPMQVEGILRQVLHGPKGEVRGILLVDGRTGRFPPQAAADLIAFLQPGARLLLLGDGLSSPLGTVLALQAIGTAPEAMVRIGGKSPGKSARDKPFGHKHEGHEHPGDKRKDHADAA